MSGYPGSADLIDAVEAFVRGIEGSLKGREAFHAKVAANVLAIVARELRQGSDAGLGDAGALCAGLRDGKLNADTPGLLDTLIAATRAQLAVDNPKYSTLARLGAPP